MSTSRLPSPYGPYTLRQRLAAGGMAEVYLGSAMGASGFQKPVAIKRIHPQLAARHASGGMLADEAKLAVALTHRNIVQTFDLRRFDDGHVIVMEYVDGYDAQQLLDAMRQVGRQVPVDLAAHVIAELCRGLDYAHRHRDDAGEPAGLVHRDVSPQNVLLSFAGEVKIADFGIAKSKERPSDPESKVIKGKYFYMSPEQARGETLDARSDIFSAGVVLWELLVGERLHDAHDVRELLEAVRRADIPLPSTFRMEVPSALDEIATRATAKDPADRFRNAGEMADALAAFLATRPSALGSRRLGELVCSVQPPAEATEPMPDEPMPDEPIPQTRDRVRTLPLEERRTPAESPLRFDLDEGEPTVAGWQSPSTGAAARGWVWLLALGSTAAALVSWLLHGS